MNDASVLPKLSEYHASLITKSPDTTRRYMSGLTRFAQLDIALDESCLERFYLECRSAGLQQATACTNVAGVSSYLRFLVRRGESSISLEQARAALDAVMERSSYPSPEIPQGIEKILDAAVNESLRPHSLRQRRAILRDRALLSMLLRTGLRRSEACRLTRTQGVQDEVTLLGKGKKERVVFIDTYTRDLVAHYQDQRVDTGWSCFARHDRPGEGLPLSPGGVWKIVDHWAKVAGVEAHPHLFRHAFTCDLLNAEVPLSVVQELVGHASPTTTKRIYGRHDRATLRAAMQKVHGRGQ